MIEKKIVFLFLSIYSSITYCQTVVVHIDSFLKPNSTVNEALKLAMLVGDHIVFSNKIYQIEPISISPKQLLNPNRLVLEFQNTTLQAKNGLQQVQIISFEDIPNLTFNGQLMLDGNVSKQNINNPTKQAEKAFLQIVAPSNSQNSSLTLGHITFTNMPMCGITIDTHDNFRDWGYDRIKVGAFREINGYNGLNVQKEDFAVWGVNVRGAHRAVYIDSLYADQSNEIWGDMQIEKPFYTFTFENQADPTVHVRKDSLYIKSLHARYACAIVLYTQAANNIRIDNYLIENTLQKPNTDYGRVYPNLMRRNISWIGSKHTWTSYKSSNSSFYIKKLVIRNANPVFLKSSNDLTGLWLNKGISGAIIDEVETDVRLKLYGDGYYFGFENVPDGNHKIKKFWSKIPYKDNYIQPLNMDLTIDKLYLTKASGVTFSMGNARIGSIVQEKGSKATFESRENRFKNQAARYNGFIVDSCKAENIIWKFNWIMAAQAEESKIVAGERYEFKNFSGNNLLQTETNIAQPSGRHNYVSAYKYDADANARSTIQKHLQFVEFNWHNVSMRLLDKPDNNMAVKYLPYKTNKNYLLNTSRKSFKGWRTNWRNNTFKNCQIVP